MLPSLAVVAPQPPDAPGSGIALINSRVRTSMMLSLVLSPATTA
jgi:hypothetical protein